MKINRFNENNDQKSVKQFIIDFSDSTDDGVPDWISEVSNTKLKEYKDTISFNKMLFKKAIKFADTKKLPKFKEYLLIDEEIEKLEKQVEKLKNKRDNVLYYNASGELLYKFQEELLEKDFDSFYNLFLEDAINDNYDYIFGEVHPNIFKKYKSIINKNLTIKRYNL